MKVFCSFSHLIYFVSCLCLPFFGGATFIWLKSISIVPIYCHVKDPIHWRVPSQPKLVSLAIPFYCLTWVSNFICCVCDLFLLVACVTHFCWLKLLLTDCWLISFDDPLLVILFWWFSFDNQNETISFFVLKLHELHVRKNSILLKNLYPRKLVAWLSCLSWTYVSYRLTSFRFGSFWRVSYLTAAIFEFSLLICMNFQKKNRFQLFNWKYSRTTWKCNLREIFIFT